MSASAKSKTKARRSARPRRARAGQERAPSSTRLSERSSLSWVRELAAPYLKGYSATAAREEGLEGCWFLENATETAETEPTGRKSRRLGRPDAQAGFFVGYLNEISGKYSFLKPDAPECLIFAWISPADGELHRRLVREPGSLVRKTFEYIRWLTHRPPRFVFHEKEEAAMVRHTSMAAWPPQKRQHLSRNFFIETLAWLVRSGLVRKLREEAALPRMN